MPRVIKTAPSVYEDFLIESGLWPVVGVDEAGRGPLAGPVLACALILPPGTVIEGVNDSKKLSPARREELAVAIKEAAYGYAFGIVEAAEIDRVNILRATMLAMSQAVSGLTVLIGRAPRVVLVDGTAKPPVKCPAICVKRGDSASHLIAAASILAKVKRDAIMADLHDSYPIYGFNAHKGYGTAAHREALKRHGLCPQHRKSFCHGFIGV